VSESKTHHKLTTNNPALAQKTVSDIGRNQQPAYAAAAQFGMDMPRSGSGFDRGGLYPAGANSLRSSALSSISSRIGQVIPITAARRTYSAIAVRPIRSDREITRSHAPQLQAKNFFGA
jgi:hypothetical protein